MIGYLLITLPFDYITSELPYSLTELFDGELPLDYSSTWLSYSLVSYPLDTLPFDYAIELFVTKEVSD